MTLSDSSQALANSFDVLWAGVINYLPQLVIALIIFIVGWIIAAVLGRVVDQVVKAVKLDSALRSAGLDGVLSRAGFNLNSGRFIGGLVKWFVIIVFLVASFEVLGLTQVNIFLQDVVLGYLPQVFVAVLIMLVAVVIADVVQKVVAGGAKAAHMPSAAFAGSLTKWAIWIFAALISLSTLGVAPTFLQTLFTGVVVALALAFGLAFGLGGQQAAADFLAKIRREITDHK